MVKIISCIFTGLLLTGTVIAEVRVFTCEPEWKSLVEELGGSRVTAFSATTAQQDPHRVEARPSLIAKLRRADLLICSGADLEVAWLPALLQQSANAKVLEGRPGHFEAAAEVELVEKLAHVDRRMGDVHAAGNPHLHLDPHRIAQIAKALSARLLEIDPEAADHYRQRYADFEQRWQQAIQSWQQRAEPLKGKRIVVYHKNWPYLLGWLNMQRAGTLEPKPGLPTTAGHLTRLKQQLTEEPADMIIHTAYQSSRGAQRLATLTDIPVVELPYTVGGSAEVTDLFRLFDVTISRLLAVSQ